MLKGPVVRRQEPEKKLKNGYRLLAPFPELCFQIHFHFFMVCYLHIKAYYGNSIRFGAVLFRHWLTSFKNRQNLYLLCFITNNSVCKKQLTSFFLFVNPKTGKFFELILMDIDKLKKVIDIVHWYFFIEEVMPMD